MSGIIDFNFSYWNILRFWPVFLTEFAVIALVYKGRSRNAGPLGRRLADRWTDASGLWCLPFYLWAWQANLVVNRLFTIRVGLDKASNMHIPNEMQAIFVALLHLLAIQTIATIITKSAPLTLGLL